MAINGLSMYVSRLKYVNESIYSSLVRRIVCLDGHKSYTRSEIVSKYKL